MGGQFGILLRGLGIRPTRYIDEFSKKNGYEQNEVFRSIVHHVTILSSL